MQTDLFNKVYRFEVGDKILQFASTDLITLTETLLQTFLEQSEYVSNSILAVNQKLVLKDGNELNLNCRFEFYESDNEATTFKDSDIYALQQKKNIVSLDFDANSNGLEAFSTLEQVFATLFGFFNTNLEEDKHGISYIEVFDKTQFKGKSVFPVLSLSIEK